MPKTTSTSSTTPKRTPRKTTKPPTTPKPKTPPTGKSIIIDNTGKLTITIDSRESAWIKKWLPTQFKNVNFEVKALSEGDYGSEHVLIERKTISDLWSSLNDNRFHSQLDRLCTHHDKVIIYLITGSIDEWLYKMKQLHINVNEDIIDGCIASLLVRCNVRVICDSHEKAALKRMVRMILKVEAEGVLDMPSKRNPDMLAARLLNVSKTEWFAIKEMFGSSLCFLCNVSEKDLCKVKGIGPKKAKNIIQIMKHGW